MNLRSILCRKRQQLHREGDLVRFYDTRIIAKVEAYRWNYNSKCWEYHLEGFPGWTKQNLIKAI